jgi:hypothetical protein
VTTAWARVLAGIRATWRAFESLWDFIAHEQTGLTMLIVGFGLIGVGWPIAGIAWVASGLIVAVFGR